MNTNLIILFLVYLPLCLMHGHSHGDDDHGHGHLHGHHHGHSHGETDDFHKQIHDHYHESNHHENPSFKYSKEANLVDETETIEHNPDDIIQEQIMQHENLYQPELHGHEHLHDHTDKLPHGHSHGGDYNAESHAHNKKSHGHSHSGDNNHGHSHEHLHEPLIEKKQHEHVDKKMLNPVTEKEPEENYDIWCEAIGATLLISLAPILILFFIPLDKKSPTHAQLLNILLSFASGGLLGDAFLHLIPHAISASGSENLASHSHVHSHGHSHGSGGNHEGNIAVSMWVLLGIVVFLAVEKFVRFAKGGHGHSHEHEDPHLNKENEKITDKKTDQIVETDKCEGSDIKVAAYLNMAADFAHNFTDGLAIGASFMAGRNVGLITTVTILFHEVPHEIGDFAILVQSGCSKKRAMLLQMTTAIGAILGTICSLIAEGSAGLASSWILPFTAGGFIYIATVSILPELLSENKVGQSLKEITALLVGIGMMALIAEFE